MRNRQTETQLHNGPNPFSKQPKRRLSNKSKFWAIVIGVVILLGVGTWLAWPTLSGLFNKTETVQDDPNQLPEVDEKTKRLIAVQEEAATLSQSEGKEAARVYVDEKIAAADNNEEKAMLLIYKSTLSADIPGAPLQYAHDADDLDPSYTSASALASYYESAGDNDNAVKYYKLMLERAEPGFAETFADDYATIQKKIVYLESL